MTLVVECRTHAGSWKYVHKLPTLEEAKHWIRTAPAAYYRVWSASGNIIWTERAGAES